MASTRDSGPVRVVLDGVADETLSATLQDAAEAVGAFFSDADNAVEAEHRVLTAAVP